MDCMNKKVTVIGAGRVGSTTAHLIALKGLADVVIINRTEGIAKGIALDIQEAMPSEGMDARVSAGSDYGLMEGSDIVVMTAGAQRKEGMSRDDLLKVNASIVTGAGNAIKQYAPNSVVIVVTNPLDAMAYLMGKVTGFGRGRVIGMAGALDSSRLNAFLAIEAGCSVKDVNSMVLGSHGDSMVAALSVTTVKGASAAGSVAPDRLASIVSRTREAGAEIIKLEGSSAFYAPASAVVSMVEAVLKDTKRVIPCSTQLKGEYGISDVYVGVPAVLGKNGVEKVVQIALTDGEKAAFEASAKAISESISRL